MPLTRDGENYREFSEPRFFECAALADVAKIRNPVDKAHAIFVPTDGGGTEVWKFEKDAVDTAVSPDIITPSNTQVSGRWKRGGTILDASLFGVTGDGTTDDTTAMQTAWSAAAATGHPLFVRGTPLITSQLVVTAGATKFTMYGEGQSVTNFICRVNGTSAFNVGNSTWTTFRDFKMTGDSSSGHAIRAVDPAVGSGTYMPQHLTLENVFISSFSGADVDHLGAAMPACGIFGVNALEGDIIGCSFADCDIGIYLYLCYTIRTHSCTFDGNTFAAYIDQGGEGNTIDDSDIVDGTLTASTFSLVAVSYNGSATVQKSGIIIADCVGACIHTTKVKNYYYAVLAQSSNPPLIAGCIIIVDGENGRGIRANGPIKAIGNTITSFYQAEVASDRVYIHYSFPANVLCWMGDIVGNDFIVNGGGNYDAFIQVDGSTGSYPTSGVIEGNRFGSISNAANTTLYRSGIKLTGTSDIIYIRGNRFMVTGSVTITSLFNITSGSTSGGPQIENNHITISGGTVTNTLVPPSAGQAYRYVTGGIAEAGVQVRTGRVTLVGGVAVVALASNISSNRIFVSHADSGASSANLGHLYITDRTDGVGFTIRSTGGSDDSIVDYVVFPAPN